MDEGSFTEGVTNSTSDPNDPYNRNQEAYVSKVLARATFANVAGYFWFRRNDSLGPGLGGDWAFGLLTEQGPTKPSYSAYKYFVSLVRSTSQSVGQLTLANPKLEGYEIIANDGRRFQVSGIRPMREPSPTPPPSAWAAPSPILWGGPSPARASRRHRRRTPLHVCPEVRNSAAGPRGRHPRRRRQPLAGYRDRRHQRRRPEQPPRPPPSAPGTIARSIS